MPDWGKSLLVGSVGVLAVLVVLNGFISDEFRKLLYVESEARDFVILKRWGIWSRASFYWYSRRGRDRRAFFYGLVCGTIIAAPLASIGMPVLFFLAFVSLGGICGELANYVGQCYVASLSAHERFPGGVWIDPNLARWVDRRRAAIEGAMYWNHTFATGVVAFVYFVLLTARFDVAAHDVVSRVSSIVSAALAIFLPALYHRVWWQRRFLATRVQMAISRTLKLEPGLDGEIAVLPIGVADASYPIRERLVKVARSISSLAVRIANSETSRDVIHPLSVVLWHSSDQIRDFLKSPRSLNGAVPDDITALLLNVSALLAGPKAREIYQLIVADDAIFERDWSNRRGGLRERVLGRILTIVDRADKIRTMMTILAILAGLTLMVALELTGRIRIKELIDALLGQR